MCNDMERLIERLKNEAVALNACKKGLRDFPATLEGAIERWKKNIDFAIENDFPSLDVMREDFDRETLHENLIFVDDCVNIEYAPNGVYVLNGHCTGTIMFRDYAMATLYVRHTSDISVIAEGDAKIYVRLCDEAKADVVEVGNARVRVHQKS